jgi:diaminopimelate epimerase
VLLKFTKYHGHGNDFILVDNMEGTISLSAKQIQFLCHRHFGIGSDGIILLEYHPNHDYHMVFYNPDASQSFCGNGSRCALDFANELGLIADNSIFLAIDGTHQGIIDGDLMCIHMNDVSGIENGDDYYYLNTGSPHYVKLVENVKDIDVLTEGRSIRYSERFREVGTNVNFLQLSQGIASSRVYERGVENETYSSGTGTTAQAISAYLHDNSLGQNIHVETKGGRLNVSFEDVDKDHFTNIWLKGKVHRVFTGEVRL